jgi:subtilisin family serine protease
LLRVQLSGSPDVRIGLVDGAVDITHPAMTSARLEKTGSANTGKPPSAHATFIASVFAGREPAMGLCPECTIVSLPVFTEAFEQGRLGRAAASALLADGIKRAVSQHVDVIHMSTAFWPEAGEEMAPVAEAISSAAARGVRTVCAAGNRAFLGFAEQLAVPGLVPVAAMDTNRQLAVWSPVSPWLGRHGLGAPGLDIPGVAEHGMSLRSGSSFAAAFVTAVFALLRSAFPRRRSPEQIWRALLGGGRSVVPAPVDAEAALLRLRKD